MTPFIVMEVLEKATEMEQQGINIIHMEVGEPDFDMPKVVAEAAIRAITDGKSHYTHSLGEYELRKALVDFYFSEYGVEIAVDQIVITSGSSAAISLALLALCGVGDEVIVSNPGYSCYRNFILACRATPIEVNVSAENGFEYDISTLKKSINNKTKAIFVNSPMNPSGNLVSAATFKELSKLGIPIISDEIYHGLVYDGCAQSILEFTKDAFVINGFSKRFAMTGMRLGYLIAPKEYMRTLQILHQNLAICAPSIAQWAGIAALKSADDEVQKMKETYNERRIFLIERLREMGFIIEHEPKGAFYVLADARRFTNDSYKFAFDILENAHVGVTPGVDFGTNGEGFIRFSYSTSIENIQEGMKRLKEYLGTLSYA